MDGQPDPVLLLLQAWMRERRLTRAAVARELGVSRAAVAGWLLELEARERGQGQRPASGRRFVFTSQRLPVQRRISEVLGQPVQALVALSGSVAAGRDWPGGGELGPESAAEVATMTSAGVWQATEGVLEALAAQGLAAALGATGQLPQTLRHRTAEVIESVEGVAGTLMLAEFRGHPPRRVLYQHQIAVFADVPDGADPDAYCRRVRAEIDQAMTTVSVVGWWEHPAMVPNATLSQGGRAMHLLGSLISPYLDRPRPPRNGLLIRPATGIGRQPLRVGAVVGGQYSGSEPIAGSWADSLGTGHIRATDLVRRAADVQYRRSGRGTAGEHAALLSDLAKIDAGYIVHQGLHLLQTGVIPGAWLLSLEPDRLDEYPPLHDALVQLRGVVVLLFMVGDWARLAAWRLAAAERDAMDPSQPVLNTAREGATASGQELRTLAEHHARAEIWADRIEYWNQLLQRVRDQRGSNPDRPTLSLTLADLPPDLEWFRLQAGVWRHGRGPTPAGAVIFPDAVDDFTDVWLLAAADLLAELATAAGRPTSSSPEAGPAARSDAQLGDLDRD